MAYIANKPVRFDRNYSIGEIIPDEVIDPKMKKRLIDWGKIIQVNIPENKEKSDGKTENSDILAEDRAKKKNTVKKR